MLQYQCTSNRELPTVEFYLDRLFAAEQPGHADVMAFRDFIRALTVPPAVTYGVVDTSPPRTLFIWPSFLTMEAVLSDVFAKGDAVAVVSGAWAHSQARSQHGASGPGCGRCRV